MENIKPFSSIVNKSSVKHFFQLFLSAWRLILAAFIPIALLPVFLVNNTHITRAAYGCILMALFWMFELLPLAITALLPVILWPLFGIIDTDTVSRLYMKETVMMFVGGLLVAVAVEHCNLHKRIALKVLMHVSNGLHWLLLGFMLTTMFLSMWISNTATTAMMVPIIDAVIQEISTKSKENAMKLRDVSISAQVDNKLLEPDGTEKEIVEKENSDFYSSTIDTSLEEKEKSSIARIRLALLLGIAYAANCGGTGSLTGTGPNLILKGQLEQKFPKSKEITFATWMMYNVPGMLICVFVAWVFLIFAVMRYRSYKGRNNDAIKETILRQYKELGNITFHEGAVLLLFTILVLLWLLRDPKFIPGWVVLFPEQEVDDATPAIAIAVLLFLIPARPKELGKSPPLLDWKTAQNKLPWGVVLLIGGGFGLAAGAQESNLSYWVGNQLTYFRFLPTEAIVIVLCIITTTLTEVVSNTATATIVLPVVIQLALAIEVNPLYFALPVTITCSYAFMLPVATPPNAIVFDAGKMRIPQMMVPGFVMNILCCLIQFGMITTLGRVMFQLNNFPDWAVMTSNYNRMPNSTIYNVTILH